MVEARTTQSLRLGFDPLDRDNLDRLETLISATPEYRTQVHGIPAIDVADLVLKARSLEMVGGPGTGFELAKSCVGTRVPDGALRSFFGLLPDPGEAMEVSIPRALEAREITSELSKLATGSSETARLLQYDMKHANSRFFLLAYDFGIQPSPVQTVSYARFKSTLAPARIASGNFIRTYSIAPQTSWQQYGSKTMNLTVNGELGFEVHDLGVGSVEAAARASTAYVYQTQYTLATSTVVGSTNGNEVVSWAMKPGPQDGQDPRGWFRLYATIGVPRAFGETAEELGSRFKARLVAKVRTNWTLSQGRNYPKSASVPVEFICPT